MLLTGIRLTCHSLSLGACLRDAVTRHAAAVLNKGGAYHIHQGGMALLGCRKPLKRKNME